MLSPKINRGQERRRVKSWEHMTGGCGPEIPAFYKKEPVRGRERAIQETASLYGLIRMGQDSTNWNYSVTGSLQGQTGF